MMLSTLPRTFVSVVETGSITKAADALGMAKSAISQNLKRLEDQLGVKLAVRTTRRLTLTPAGERYYARCKDMLALSGLADREMEYFGAHPAGPVTITAPHALIANVLAPAITEVLKQFPKLEPNIIADDHNLDIVGRGIDLAISVGHLPDSSLRARRIGVLHDTLCVHPKLLGNKPNTDSHNAEWQEWLNSLPYLAHSREGERSQHALHSAHAKAPLNVSFTRVIKCNTIESLASFVREGAGVALLPDIAIAQDLKAGRLVPLLPDDKSEPIPIYAVHAYDTKPPLSVSETIKSVSKQLTLLSDGQRH